MRRFIAGLLAAIIIWVGAIFGAGSASADTYGWKWDHTTISVQNDTRDRDVKAGLLMWNSVSDLDASIVHSAGEITVAFEDMPEGSGWAAYADQWVSNGVAFGCHIGISNLYNPQMGKRNAVYGEQWNTTLAGHESGHCFGLAHTSDTTIPSVMRAVASSTYSSPTDYDKTQINSLYPLATTATVTSSEQVKVTKFRKSGLVRVTTAVKVGG